MQVRLQNIVGSDNIVIDNTYLSPDEIYEFKGKFYRLTRYKAHDNCIRAPEVILTEIEPTRIKLKTIERVD